MTINSNAIQEGEAVLPSTTLTHKEERFLKLTALDCGSELKNRSVRGAAVLIVAEGVDFVLRIASITILARLLVPEYFGLLGMVTVITAIAERFKDFGLSMATVQRETISHEEISTLFWINAGVGVAIASVVIAAAYPLAAFYNDARLAPITLAIAVTFIFSGLTTQHQALLRRQMKFPQTAAIQIGSNALSIVIAIALAVAGAGYWALVAREVFRSVLAAAGTWMCFPWIPGAPTRKAKVGSMLRFGGDLSVFNFAYFFSSSVDHILIGKFFGAAALGIYRQGVQLVLMPTNQLVYPVTTIGESVLSRLQGDPDKYRRFYCKLQIALSTVTMPLALVLAMYAEEIVLVLLGKQWLAATNIFRILAIASFMKPAISTSGFVMVTCGLSRRYLILGVLQSIAQVLFFVAGIPWGPEGIAFGHVVCVYLLMVPKLWLSFKDTPINLRIFAGAVARPLTSTLFMGGFLYVLKSVITTDDAWISLISGLSLGVLVYSVTWLLLPGGRSQMRDVWTDLRSAFGLSRVSAAA
jgi:O-antigen/teichoic acid export membrane protein